MAWMISSPQIHNTFTSLGTKVGDTYTVNEDCLELLQEILKNLAYEDSSLRSFRRAVGFGQNIKKDLIPLLIYVKDDANINHATKIIDTTIKILVNLTIPVEYLVPMDNVTNTDVGRHTLYELTQLLILSKEAFSDSRSTKAITDHIKYIMEKDVELNVEQCDGINNCLLLLRNILHIPEYGNQTSSCPLAHSSMQNQIIWNLFTQSIDKIIIYLLSCPQRLFWGITIVQLIALMYKDQHLGTLQKLLNLWLEAWLSDSSEDNESNTSPPDQGSGDSSPVITSAPTSDSSDNGGSGKSNDRKTGLNVDARVKGNTGEPPRNAQSRGKNLVIIKRNKSIETETSTSSGVSVAQSVNSTNSSKSMSLKEKSVEPIAQIGSKKSDRPPSQSEISDCGYVTQMENENQESISTSSNDDEQPHQKPVHQKPHTFLKTRYKDTKPRGTTASEKKDLRRKRLVRRSKTNIINMKGLMHHQPTDEDITHILKEFTVDFLLKGYGSLVQNLYSQFLTNTHVHIDTSHFFWLMTYFLKLATQLELELEHVAPVLSYDILSFLVFQGVWLSEELEISCRDDSVDIKPCLRRLHLVVTAIREYIQAVETYKKLAHLSEEDHAKLLKLQTRISETEDLMYLFVLLMRQYNPEIQSKQYLQDLILTNHNHLLLLDSISKAKGQATNVMDHLKQFASVDIMRQYGILLEDFEHNGEFVNNCVLTMMHHIGGDLENISVLFQPSILKSFLKIWETDYELCNDWSDLIEYVIHKFINTRHTYYSNVYVAPADQNFEKLKAQGRNRWTKEDKDNLQEYYKESIDTSDIIERISKKYVENGITNKTQTAIIKELLEQNIINENQYNDFMKTNQSEPVAMDSNEEAQNSESTSQCIEETVIDGEVRVLKEYLYKENKGKMLLWLQQILIEVCFVKLFLLKSKACKENPMQPSIYYYALLNLPIPIVPWFAEHSNILKYQPFMLLLQKLGFYLPVSTGKTFVRIPNFWNAEHIFSIAQQLGPIDPAKLKFDIALFNNKSNTETNVDQSDETVTNVDSDCTKYSANRIKMPSVVRYTPLPNTTGLFQTHLQSSEVNIPLRTFPQISGMNQLTVTIPEVHMLCNIPPPKLSIVEHGSSLPIIDSDTAMDCSSFQETHPLLNDDTEHGSMCDTASVASDLTRMCVSDEDEKILSDDDDKTMCSR